MTDFIFEHSGLHGIIQITPKINTGEKDLFVKSYEKNVYANNGIDFIPTEEYMIKEDKFIFRGIHFQNIKPQKRILTVLSGSAYVTVVDFNKTSPQLGQFETFLLKGNFSKLLFVPAWYGVATISLEDNTIISVKNSGLYYAEYSTGIRYDDNNLNIQWPVKAFQISDKDKHLMTFEEYLNS